MDIVDGAGRERLSLFRVQSSYLGAGQVFKSQTRKMYEEVAMLRQQLETKTLSENLW